MGAIYRTVKDKTTVIGFTGTDGYSFDDSEAVVDGHFVGLAIDEDNESNLTDERINKWVEELRVMSWLTPKEFTDLRIYRFGLRQFKDLKIQKFKDLS